VFVNRRALLGRLCAVSALCATGLGAAASGSANAGTTAKHRLRVVVIDVPARTMHSSTGTKLSVGVSVSFQPHGHQGQVDVDIATPGSAGSNTGAPAGAFGEDHTWEFALHRKSAADAHKSGKVAIHVGRGVLGRYGSLRLVFHPAGHGRHLSCNSNATERVFAGRLHGHLTFGTHSGHHGWGSLHGKLAKHASVTEFGGPQACQQNAAPLSCPTPTIWQGGTFYGGAKVVDGKQVGYLVGVRDVRLAKSTGESDRIDSITKRVPLPTVSTGSGGNVTVAVTTNGHGATGSAQVTSDYPPKTGRCGPRAAGHHHRDASATTTMGNRPLRVTGELYRPIVGTDGSGFVDLRVD
jgi:hypothetical protein